MLGGAVWFAVYQYSVAQSAPKPGSNPAKDPSSRYVGPAGVVVGQNNMGGAWRLPAGTRVKVTKDRYIDPISGPISIYTIMEGDYAGARVPIRERDLLPK